MRQLNQTNPIKIRIERFESTRFVLPVHAAKVSAPCGTVHSCSRTRKNSRGKLPSDSFRRRLSRCLASISAWLRFRSTQLLRKKFPVGYEDEAGFHFGNT